MLKQKITSSDEQEQSAVAFLREGNISAYLDLCKERKLSVDFIMKCLTALLKHKASSRSFNLFKDTKVISI